MIKKKIYQDGKLYFELYFRGKDSDRQVVSMYRVGDAWAAPYQATPLATLKSDGNGLDLAFYRKAGEKPAKVRLEYHEVAELGMLFQEYTKSDPYAPKPLYEIKGCEQFRGKREAEMEKIFKRLDLAPQSEQAAAAMNSILSTVNEVKPDHYCWTCGAGCITTTGYGLFDTKTGKQRTWPIYKCPNRRWYQFWHSVEYDYHNIY